MFGTHEATMKGTVRQSMPRSFVIYLSAVLLLAIASGQTAHAASSDQIVRDCIDGVINGNYSNKDLNRAKGQIPDDVAQYTSCLDAINDALSGSKGSKNKVADLGVFESKPIEPDAKAQKKLKKAESKGDKPIVVGDSKVIPGSPSLLKGSGLIADMPVSVAILIGLIGISMITAAGLSIYRNRGGFKKLGRLFKR